MSLDCPLSFISMLAEGPTFARDLWTPSSLPVTAPAHTSQAEVKSEGGAEEVSLEPGPALCTAVPLGMDGKSKYERENTIKLIRENLRGCHCDAAVG